MGIMTLSSNATYGTTTFSFLLSKKFESDFLEILL